MGRFGKRRKLRKKLRAEREVERAAQADDRPANQVFTNHHRAGGGEALSIIITGDLLPPVSYLGIKVGRYPYLGTLVYLTGPTESASQR